MVDESSGVLFREMTESSASVALVHRFFSGTGPSYDWVVKLCTIGCDLWWKRKILARIPQDCLGIIDQACGTGILTFQIAQKFPDCRVVGVELREEYLRIAVDKERKLKLRNVEFILGRAEEVLLKERFDCITSSYLAKYADFGALVKNAGKMLREEGMLIMHDFTYPPGPLFSVLWEFYFKILQRLGSRKYPQWKTVFDELPELLRNTRWVDELVRSLKEHAFSSIHVEPLTFGSAAIVTARRR